MRSVLPTGPAGVSGRPSGAPRPTPAGFACTPAPPAAPVSSRHVTRGGRVCRARHSPLVGGGDAGGDWKDALATLQVPKGVDGDDDTLVEPPLGWGATFGGGDDDGGGGEGDDDGAIAASFDLDGPDGDDDFEGGSGTYESSWGDEDGDDDDNEDYEFVPDDGAGRGRGGGRASSGGVVEEILFSLEDGWGLEALSASAAGAAASTSSSAPPQTGRTKGDGRAGTAAEEEEEEEELSARARSRSFNPKSALASIPSHVLASLQAAQARAGAEAAATTPNARRRAAAERRTHRRLRIIGGSAAGRRLLSGAGETTRPMMDKVRAALFDALSSGGPAGPGRLPPTSTWLDLFAGTGAVGLEALSRGASGATFVEMDAWVVSAVLKPNLAACAVDFEAEGAGDGGSPPPPLATPVQGKAQDFIARHPGPPFDYVSVCPPYEAVSYGELMASLSAAAGRILHLHSFVIVEYPRLAACEMPDSLGPLARLRDRKYGRTLVAIYGPE